MSKKRALTFREYAEETGGLIGAMVTLLVGVVCIVAACVASLLYWPYSIVLSYIERRRRPLQLTGK